MFRITQQHVGRMQGMTLIELLIVVVIIGILTTIAYPSYMDQVRKARRADGKAMLLEKSQQLERCYTRFGVYNAGGCNVTLPDTTPEEFYVIAALTPPTAASFTLAATPQKDQVNDTRCGVLRLTSDGVEGSLGVDIDANDCW